MNWAQTLYVLCYKVCSIISPDFFTFVLFILAFVISAIAHQQIVTMPGEHLRFVCSIDGMPRAKINDPDEENISKMIKHTLQLRLLVI